MLKVFVSYRREDSEDVTGRICDRLVAEFHRLNVFKDVDSIPLGFDFRKHLQNEVSQCDVLLAVIGTDWLEIRDEYGNRRIDDEADFVRIEIEAALQRDIPVIPLLVRGASMPREGQLPRSLRQLAFRNGTQIEPDPNFHRDVDRLIRALRQLEAQSAARPPSSVPAAAPAPAEPEPAQLECPACGETLPVAEEHAGGEISCPGCKSPLEVSPERDRLTLVRTPPEADDAERHPGRTPDSAVAPPAFEVVNSIGMKMVLIPAGEFLMGSPDSDECSSDCEKPQHRVRITKPFYLGIYPVTQEQYERVMEGNPSFFKGDPQRPVELVSWNDAVEFCRRLSALADEEAAGCVYRLPTEAEWEYACRAGSTTKWCFGDCESLLTDYAWYAENSADTTHPVGQKEPNAWGLYDMHGNVWEWLADRYQHDYYRNSPADDPQGPDFGEDRVLRGGSWGGSAWRTRSADRVRNNPGNRLHANGFRVARTA